MIYHYIMIYYGYILSGFPNDERVEPCRPRRFPSSLLFLVPSFSGFIMFHLIPFSKKKHSPCPLCWAWASWWGNPAEHPKLQRDREICFPCLPCTASVELASTKLQLCSKELQRSAIGSGCSHETGGRSAVSLEVCDHQCVCVCVRARIALQILHFARAAVVPSWQLRLFVWVVSFAIRKSLRQRSIEWMVGDIGAAHHVRQGCYKSIWRRLAAPFHIFSWVKSIQINRLSVLLMCLMRASQFCQGVLWGSLQDFKCTFCSKRCEESSVVPQLRLCKVSWKRDLPTFVKTIQPLKCSSQFECSTQAFGELYKHTLKECKSVLMGLLQIAFIKACSTSLVSVWVARVFPKSLLRECWLFARKLVTVF